MSPLYSTGNAMIYDNRFILTYTYVSVIALLLLKCLDKRMKLAQLLFCYFILILSQLICVKCVCYLDKHHVWVTIILTELYASHCKGNERSY